MGAGPSIAMQVSTLHDGEMSEGQNVLLQSLLVSAIYPSFKGGTLWCMRPVEASSYIRYLTPPLHEQPSNMIPTRPHPSPGDYAMVPQFLGA